MKTTPLVLNWHNDNAPIYSAHFQPNGNRLATAGGDNNVRLWKIEADGEDRNVEYLSTLTRHIQAVNVVRFAPKGETLASAGDDGSVLTWIRQDHVSAPAIGNDNLEDKESWRVKHTIKCSQAEIYDLAWAPDAAYFIIGSMDNIARIYNAQNGQLISQIAEHNHYVQGVAWDPLNEYFATQSSDRSVHIYTLRNKDGLFSLDQQNVSTHNHHNRIAAHIKMDLPGRRISSPAPPDMSLRSHSNPQIADTTGVGGVSPAPSAPGTPNTFALPMNPPSVSVNHSRRSSFGSSPSMRRSASPAPSMPLPAVRPMDPSASPRPYSLMTTQSVKNSHLYANDSMTSFFRRLTFTPDGSLLLTPAGQYTQTSTDPNDPSKTLYEVINTVYIYCRSGIANTPMAHLPGSKKPSVVIKSSPVIYTLRKGILKSKAISIDTSSKEGSDELTSLPEPAVSSASRMKDPETPTTNSSSVMEPPPILPVSMDPSGPTSSPRKVSSDMGTTTPKAEKSEAKVTDKGPPSAWALPYRMIYAVATQDNVLLYDTQQLTPICVVSNLHFAAFTDLTWSNDGLTLLMTSSDGFCSTMTFAPGELGQTYSGPLCPPLSGLGSVVNGKITLNAHSGPSIPTGTGFGVGLERSQSGQGTPAQTPNSAAGAGSASPFPSHSHSHSSSNSNNWSNSGIGHQRSSSSASGTGTSLSNVAGGFSTPASTPVPSSMAANSPQPTSTQTPHLYQPTPIPSSFTNAGFVSTTPGAANSFSSYGRPGSPTRSNSTSSVATQASNITGLTGFGISSSNNMRDRESMSRDRESVISNPSLMVGTVPAIGYGVGVGATPPQTPRSAASSVVGAGLKRDVSEAVGEAGAESEGTGNESVGGRVEGGEKKRRRIAPTLVSGGDSSAPQ